MLAGIETGGTKVVCAIADAPGRIHHRFEVPTTTPDETFARIRDELDAHRPFAAIGVSAFGPVETDPASPRHGEVLVTSKPHWQGASYIEALASFGCPVRIESDVSGACLGEWAYGAGRGQRVLAYVTVGTGIGAGIVHDGRILNGAGHYEMGHIPVIRAPGDDAVSQCPIHADCLEGLASGPSIMARWGTPLSALPDGHAGTGLEAGYLAQLVRTITLTHMPERIVFGGGVMKTPGLIEAVRQQAKESLGGYVARAHVGDLSGYIVPAALGGDAGITGALMLARQALKA